MTDGDDDALSWEGDDRLQADRRPAPRLLEEAPAEGRTASGGPVGLVGLGVLGGAALLETVFWVRSGFAPPLAAGLTPGSGTPGEIAALIVNTAGRVLGVVAPLVWFGVVATRVRVPSRRLALLVLGAALLVPWPALLGAA